MALSLLRKWQEEERPVQAALLFGKTKCTVFGRIGKIDTVQILVDNSSHDEMGNRYGLLVRLADVLRFHFEDARFFSQRSPEIMEQVDQTFESFLMIDLGPCKCSIMACRLPGELP